MTVGRGFCTQTAFKKHLDGDWKTVHELWSHIRNYMVSYAAPTDSTYSKTEIDAMFEGYSGGKAQVDAGNVVGLTQGSIPFADASGFLAEDNSNLFWDATNKRLAIGHSSPAADCSLHIEFSAQVSVNSRVAAKTRPWRQWVCLDGNWGLAIGIHADDDKIHFNYDVPIGTMDTSMIVFDGANTRVGILNASPTYPLDIGGSTRIAGSGATEFKVETSGAADPFFCLKTTNTAHEVHFALDESAAADHVDFIGQTAAVDTYFHVVGKAGQVAKMGVQIGAYRGELICGSAGHISLKNITEDKNLVFGIDDGGTNKTITWNASDDKLEHSHGLFNFADDNILTTGTLGAGQTTLADSTIADDARGLSAIFTLSANPAKSDGIAFYSEGHIGAITTDGPTYGAGIWLNIDSGATLGADVRALDIGIYEAGADCTGGNAYGLAIHMEFDDTNPPAAMYMFRLNTNEAAGHETPDALIFAANKSALAVTEGDFPFNNYLKIVVQDGTIYRIPLITEGEDENICLHSSAELRFYDDGNYVGFEAPALTADQIWVLPDADGALGEHWVTDGAGTLSWAVGAGTGDVSAAAVLADHTLIRGNGGAKGVQDSGIDIDDADNITFPDGASINLQEDITFLGATTENLIKFPDNLPDALSFMEGANAYLTFVSTDGSEAIQFHQNVGIGTATVPHGGVGYALLAIEGANANAAGPHVQFTTATDDYPLLQILNWFHDDIELLFDAYYDGAYKSSDVGSNFRIVKGADHFYIDYDSGIAQGNAVTWNNGIIVSTIGFVDMPVSLRVGNWICGKSATGLLTFYGDIESGAAMTYSDAGALTVAGCVADGTCEIMKNEDALGIIDDILKTGSSKKDEYNHERMDMKKIHGKYPFMIQEQITEDEEGKEKKEYFDKLGAKSDLIYVAIRQLVERIEELEAQ